MIFRIFFFFFLVVFPAYGQDTLLKSQDVRSIMDQLFEYHIDKKEISDVILERSLKIYVDQFDPSHAYLLDEEVAPYTLPNRNTLQFIMSGYTKDDYEIYFSLNTLFQKSIERARQWRIHWAQNPKKLIAAAEQWKSESEPEKSFARTKKDLERRHYDRFIGLLAFQIKQLKSSSYEGKEKKLIALCEKQIALIENGYLGLNDQNLPISQPKLQHEIVLRVLKSLAQSLDAHTTYFSPDEAYALKVQLEKGMCGIGVVLREGMEGIAIHELIKGGPAEKGGHLQIGDTIVEVDGIPVQAASFRHVLEIMRGKDGSKIILGILRHHGQTSDFLRVELVRSKIVLDNKRVDVEAEPFGDGIIGKITLHSFYEGSDGVSSEKDLKEAIDHLRLQGPLYGLVLDMRDNGGGFLSQAVRVSGLFISSGVVVISKYSDGSLKYYRVLDGAPYYEGPLVTLLSRGSASATEIVAQTLKDYGLTVIVGDEQTFGKGSIQHQTVTNDRTNSFFKVTIGKYYTVSGKSTQLDGVKADILIPSAYQFEELGEAYLEFPLASDSLNPAFEDPLTDVEPFMRNWFSKYYVPTLQKRQENWTALIPQLQANSQRRISGNQNYQLFLKKMKKEGTESQYGSNDLQMEESVNVVKDMIFFSRSVP